MAESVTQATGGLESWGWSESGSLTSIFACWLGVRTKAGVNMVNSWELEMARLSEEMRIGRGRKLSSSKYPHQSVVGQHLWVKRWLVTQTIVPDQAPIFIPIAFLSSYMFICVAVCLLSCLFIFYPRLTICRRFDSRWWMKILEKS